MSSDTDNLLSLRNAIKSKTQITYAIGAELTTSLAQATHLVLSSSLTIPKSSPTRLRRPGLSSTDPAAHPEDFFSVEALYIAWLLRDASGAEYMKQARENGLSVGFISVTERKSVVDWLEGRSGSHPNIVPLVSESTTPPGSPRHKHLASTVSATPRGGGAKTSEGIVSPSKRRYVSDPSDIEVVKKIKHNEIELHDRTTVLRGEKLNNFSSVRALSTDRLKKFKEANKSGSAAQSLGAPDARLQAKKAKNLFPIIMISSSPTALITMHNVKKFLQDAVFEPSQEARQHAISEGNLKPEDAIPIYRKRTHIDSSGRETESQARYVVVDSVEALSKFGLEPWDRVVCVMTTGQEWQFKNYKWKDPNQLFHHVKGMYVAWSNDPQNPKVKDWNVTELKIDPHRRHVDKSVVAHFWKAIDSWTLANKPWLTG